MVTVGKIRVLFDVMLIEVVTPNSAKSWKDLPNAKIVMNSPIKVKMNQKIFAVLVFDAMHWVKPPKVVKFMYQSHTSFMFSTLIDWRLTSLLTK